MAARRRALDGSRRDDTLCHLAAFRSPGGTRLFTCSRVGSARRARASPVRSEGLLRDVPCGRSSRPSPVIPGSAARPRNDGGRFTLGTPSAPAFRKGRDSVPSRVPARPAGVPDPSRPVPGDVPGRPARCPGLVPQDVPGRVSTAVPPGADGGVPFIRERRGPRTSGCACRRCTVASAPKLGDRLWGVRTPPTAAGIGRSRCLLVPMAGEVLPYVQGRKA